MKTINNFICEKLKISSRSNFYFDLDEMTSDDITLYDDTNMDNEDDPVDVLWEETKDILKKINNDADGFVVFRFDSIMVSHKKAESKNTTIEPYLYNTGLMSLINKIITGYDYGYALRIKGGHIEIDCINKGPRPATFYIYALTSKGYDLFDEWFNGEDDENSLNVIFNDVNHEYIHPIEI